MYHSDKDLYKFCTRDQHKMYYGITVCGRLITISEKNYAFTKMLSRGIFFQCYLRNRMIHIAFGFSHTFCKNYVLVKILSSGIFASPFIKESHGGVLRHECPYHVATSHSTTITSLKYVKLCSDKWHLLVSCITAFSTIFGLKICVNYASKHGTAKSQVT
jgi:hypothetical protein